VAVFIRVNLLIFSIILFEFAWLYAAQAEENDCPSVLTAAANQGYSVETKDNNLWKLSSGGKGIFYVLENPILCTYKISAKISDPGVEFGDFSKFINAYHKDMDLGILYRDDQGYIYKSFLILPNSEDELLEINFMLFDTAVSKLLDRISDYKTNIFLPREEDDMKTNDNWFKAYIEACFHAEKECEQFEDMYGPYQTHAECFERTKEMIDGVRELLGDGEFDYKCEQSEQSI
jgi:hypothetical protein